MSGIRVPAGAPEKASFFRTRFFHTSRRLGLASTSVARCMELRLCRVWHQPLGCIFIFLRSLFHAMLCIDFIPQQVADFILAFGEIKNTADFLQYFLLSTKNFSHMALGTVTEFSKSCTCIVFTHCVLTHKYSLFNAELVVRREITV